MGRMLVATEVSSSRDGEYLRGEAGREEVVDVMWLETLMDKPRKGFVEEGDLGSRG